MEYNDTPTFDADSETAFFSLAKEAECIMKYKIKLAKIRAGGKVFLDIGCSEGVYVYAMQVLGWDAYGLEVDSAKIKRAKERSLNVQPVGNNSFDKQSIDFILIRHVIEHDPSFMAMLEQAVMLLNPDGLLCIETPNQASFKSYLVRRRVTAGRFLAHLYPPHHINAFEPKTLKLIGAKLGLSLMKINTYSPADKNWVFASLYTKTGLIPAVHKMTAMINLGENIAAFFTK
jgi:2-polyprenyl-3-methyl-5-hydroxy-6-metoxy-1,4-benzoquinol methylase